jgi:hypothetical protein
LCVFQAEPSELINFMFDMYDADRTSYLSSSAFV